MNGWGGLIGPSRNKVNSWFHKTKAQQKNAIINGAYDTRVTPLILKERKKKNHAILQFEGAVVVTKPSQ